MHVIYSNYQEQLSHELSERIRKSRKNNPMTRHVLFLPSEALRQFYRSFLAENLSSTLDIDFCLLGDLLEICMDLGWAPSSDIGPQPTQADYQLALAQIFTQYLQTPPHDPIILQSPFYAQLSSQTIIPLAHVLSTSFLKYGLQAKRPEIFNSSSDWQAILWKEVHSRMGTRSSYPALIEELTEILLKKPCPATHFYFVSFSRLSPAFLPWVECVAKYHVVEWFFLSPCRLFWADTKSFFEGQHLLARASKKSASAAALDSLENLLIDRNPLLASMAQVARSLCLFLEDHQTSCQDGYLLPMDVKNLPPYQELWWQELVYIDQTPTLLRYVQSDLLLMRSSEGFNKIHLESDPSLIVHQCPDPDIEIQILKSHLLYLFQQDPSLQVEDILVLAVDIQPYRGLIEKHFESTKNQLPYCIHDVGIGDPSSVIQALTVALRFAIGPWNVISYKNLLEQPLIATRFSSEAILRSLEKASSQTAIQWGVDAAHRKRVQEDLGLDELQSSPGRSWHEFWQVHLDQIFSSCNNEKGLKNNQDSLGELSPILDFHQVLLTLFAPWYLRQTHQVSTWISHVRLIVKDLFSWDIAPDQMDMLENLLVSMGSLDLGVEISYKTFTDILLNRLEKIEAPWSSFRKQTLKFSSMQPMRCVPAKHICILGLSEDMYDRHLENPLFEWSLQEGIEPQPLPGQMDRYSFLEAILSARESLHLFYSRVDYRMKGETPMPSYLLNELLSYLDQSFTYQVRTFSDIHHLHHIADFQDSRYRDLHYRNLCVNSKNLENSKEVCFEEDSCSSLSIKTLDMMQVNMLLEDPSQFLFFRRLGSTGSFMTQEPLKPFDIQPNFRINRQLQELIDQNTSPEQMHQCIEKQTHSKLSFQLYTDQLHEKSILRQKRWGISSKAVAIAVCEGYEVLDLPAYKGDKFIAPTIKLSSSSQAARQFWKLSGSLGVIHPHHPHIMIRDQPRLEILRKLPAYIASYKLGWLEDDKVQIYPNKPDEGTREIDLRAMDIDAWLEALGRSADYLSQNLTPFCCKLHAYLVRGEEISYAAALSKVALARENASAKRLHLFLDGLGFFEDQEIAIKMASKWLLDAREYLLPLWQPIFNVYPCRTVVQGDDDEDV